MSTGPRCHNPGAVLSPEQFAAEWHMLGRNRAIPKVPMSPDADAQYRLRESERDQDFLRRKAAYARWREDCHARQMSQFATRNKNNEPPITCRFEDMPWPLQANAAPAP